MTIIESNLQIDLIYDRLRQNVSGARFVGHESNTF